MEKTTLSTKGQIILPKPLRDAHNWRPGTEFSVEEVPGGLLLRPRKPFPETRLDQVIGALKYNGPAKSLEEMDKAIEREVRARHARGRY